MKIQLNITISGEVLEANGSVNDHHFGFKKVGGETQVHFHGQGKEFDNVKNIISKINHLHENLTSGD